MQLWSCKGVILCTSWSWKGASGCCFSEVWVGFRTDFSFCFFTLFFLFGVLVCRDVLKVTCLASVVLEMALMTAWLLASLQTLNSTFPRCPDAGYDNRVKGLVESSRIKDIEGYGDNLRGGLVFYIYGKNSRNDCLAIMC